MGLRLSEVGGGIEKREGWLEAQRIPICHPSGPLAPWHAEALSASRSMVARTLASGEVCTQQYSRSQGELRSTRLSCVTWCFYIVPICFLSHLAWCASPILPATSSKANYLASCEIQTRNQRDKVYKEEAFPLIMTNDSDI